MVHCKIAHGTMVQWITPDVDSICRVVHRIRNASELRVVRILGQRVVEHVNKQTRQHGGTRTSVGFCRCDYHTNAPLGHLEPRVLVDVTKGETTAET